MSPWTHDALAADLMDARHKAGEIAIERLAIHGGQVDVASMRLSWSRPETTAYEVKISRADLNSDLAAAKWRRYLDSVSRLYFAIPRSMLDCAHRIPSDAGITVRGPNGWYSVRRAPSRPVTPARHGAFLTALIFRHYPAEWDGQQRAKRNVADLLIGLCANCSHGKSWHVYTFCRGGSDRCACTKFIPPPPET